MFARGMAVRPRSNGVYGGWTRAGRDRVFVRIPSELKELSRAWNVFADNGGPPELGTTPIVLVHGLSSSRTLKPLIRALGSRRPVYAPDLPGFGLSDQPIHPLDVPGLANALRRWLLDNKLAPAIVIGVSFGCQVAVDLAAAHPATVERLVLVGPTFDPEAGTPARLAMRWARNVPHASPRLAPSLIHDFIDAGPWRSMRTIRRALDDPAERKLADIEAPTLVVRPERDHLAPADWTAEVADRIPDAELAVLPKASHSIGPRAAARLTALLEPFLVDGDEELEEDELDEEEIEQDELDEDEVDEDELDEDELEEAVG
jgi:pimeloyl-ACP methyl ester carboxylesterase